MWKLWLQVVLHEYVCGVYSNWFYCAYQFQFKHYTATHNEIVGMWAHGSQFNFPPQTSSMVNQQKVSSFLGHHRRDPGRVVSQEILSTTFTQYINIYVAVGTVLELKLRFFSGAYLCLLYVYHPQTMKGATHHP
jgi:hypothetical protein